MKCWNLSPLSQYIKTRLGSLQSSSDAKEWARLLYQEIYESWLLRLLTVWFDKGDNKVDLWFRIKCGWIFSEHIKELSKSISADQGKAYADMIGEIFDHRTDEIKTRIGAIHLCEVLGGKHAERPLLHLVENGGEVEKQTALRALARIGGYDSLLAFDHYLEKHRKKYFHVNTLVRCRDYLDQRLKSERSATQQH